MSLNKLRIVQGVVKNLKPQQVDAVCMQFENEFPALYYAELATAIKRQDREILKLKRSKIQKPEIEELNQIIQNGQDHETVDL